MCTGVCITCGYSVLGGEYESVIATTHFWWWEPVNANRLELSCVWKSLAASCVCVCVVCVWYSLWAFCTPLLCISGNCSYTLCIGGHFKPAGSLTNKYMYYRTCFRQVWTPRFKQCPVYEKEHGKVGQVRHCFHWTWWTTTRRWWQYQWLRRRCYTCTYWSAFIANVSIDVRAFFIILKNGWRYLQTQNGTSKQFV